MARVEGGEVVELDFEIPGKTPSLLDAIFLGRVIEIQKPLQAAFVDVGEERPGLLPLREGKLPPLKEGESVLVQVTRTENPLENKGVRLTRMITLRLGPLLYTPFKPGLSFSKKVKDRKGFDTLFPLGPEEGLIVRHMAKPEKKLTDLFLQLREEWGQIQSRLNTKPPFCVSPPLTLFERILRQLNPSDSLFVDDRKFLKGNATYTRERAFDERCEDVWDSLFSPEILLPQGGNLYIEETRGLTVIDVNSEGMLRHSLPFNRKAIGEALRQIQLRDIGGKIVIDLIDTPQDLKPLLQALTVPSDVEIFGLSHLGLLEFIRRRKRLSLPQRLKFQLN